MIQHSFIDFNELWSNSEARLAILITSAIVLFYICDIICRKGIIPAVKKITSKTTSKWDDILFNNDVLINISRLIPPIVLKVILPNLFSESHTVFFWADKVIDIYIVATATRLACAIFNSLYDISNENQRMKNRTLKGVFEMFKIIALCIGAIIIISIVIDKNPANILTGLGAMAAVLMLVYIAFRFDFNSGVAAVFGLLHDVLMMLAFMVLLRNVVQMNSSFIAAMLTIGGYSINNTIIIFDRIRENAHKVGVRQLPREQIVNISVTESLPRTLNTTVTTLLTVVTLYILGVDSIKQFALPLIVGMLAGIYSANMINGYVWALMMDKRKK